jgi:uncharacterized protein (TIGR02466 family)
MSLHTELWFPSVVWSGFFSGIDNFKLKQFAYQKKQSDPGVVISNYTGYQSNSLVEHEHPEIQKLVAHLDSEIAQCATQTGLPELQLYNIWININPPHSYNHLHNHIGSVLSGVYYIDADENQGNIQFERNDGGEYHIPSNVEKQTYFTSTRATYKAKTSAVYIFPSWLKHSVEGNKSNSDRISIAFNYGVK